MLLTLVIITYIHIHKHFKNVIYACMYVKCCFSSVTFIYFLFICGSCCDTKSGLFWAFSCSIQNHYHRRCCCSGYFELQFRYDLLHYNVVNVKVCMLYRKVCTYICSMMHCRNHTNGRYFPC